MTRVAAGSEIAHADETFARPGLAWLGLAWLGEEVTFDPRYRNSALAAEPRGHSRTRPKAG